MRSTVPDRCGGHMGTGYSVVSKVLQNLQDFFVGWITYGAFGAQDRLG